MVVSLAQSISSGISSAMTSAITGVVDGSKTVNEALSEMFGSIGRAFVNMAAEIIAKQLVMITLQAILNALGLGAKGAAPPLPPAPDPVDIGDLWKKIPSYAEGGYVTGPTNALIGEGGEPEYVIPASKMDTAMARYSTGQRGESLVAGSGESGGDEFNYSPVINSTSFGGQDYVTVEQMNQAVREGMAVATKRGAQGGYAKTLGSLRNSRSTRARVGIG